MIIYFNFTIEKQAASENIQVAGQRDFLDREICFLQYLINGQRHRRFKSLFAMPCQILGRIIIKAVFPKNQGSRLLIYIKDIARCRFVRHPYPSLLFPCNPAAWWQASSLPRAMSGNTPQQVRGICECGSFPADATSSCITTYSRHSIGFLASWRLIHILRFSMLQVPHLVFMFFMRYSSA